MIKKILFSVAAITIGIHCCGQDDGDSKKVNHYVGIQANQLIRQLFSFNSSSSEVNNPYLISYSVNSARTGWGFASGLGYTYNQFEEGDPLNPLKSTINEFFFRAGVERKTVIGKKWLIGVGMDLLAENERNKTVSNSPFGNFTTKTHEKTFGMGPRLTLNFHITDRILLGTEASYYYKRTKSTQEVTGQEDVTEKFKQFSFVVPAVLFLSVKF